MDDISKLMQKKAYLPEEDRAKLDAYLKNQGMSPEPKKNPFKAHTLKTRQDASETLLGGLIGMEPMTEEEKAYYETNKDPNLEKGMDMALQLGMGMGGLNNIAPKALQALKGGAFTGAAKEVIEQAPVRQNMPKEIPADEVSEEVIQQMLKQRKAESNASALHRKELQYDIRPEKKLGQDITKTKNNLFKVFK